MDSAQDSDFAPVHRLIAHTMCVHAETYEGTAFRYLLGDARRWSLGSIHDYSGTSTGLVTAAAPYWDQD
ncbi:MAG: hypothetical protein MUE84_07115, partial [Hyphomonas sp.]|nr:hypothetical protein [Hyphomonas sp.]